MKSIQLVVVIFYNSLGKAVKADIVSLEDAGQTVLNWGLSQSVFAKNISKEQEDNPNLAEWVQARISEKAITEFHTSDYGLLYAQTFKVNATTVESLGELFGVNKLNNFGGGFISNRP